MNVIAVVIFLKENLRMRITPEGGYDLETRIDGIGWVLDNEGVSVNDRHVILEALGILQKLDAGFSA
jgi:hypothetical protein